MIPKVIHFIWFGDKMPERIKVITNSWRTLMPEYKFIKWNESNSGEFLNNQFVCQAMKDKNYAFVSDYIRLKVLYEYGGIYLDTDMIIIKKLDDFLSYKTFWGRMYSNAVGTAIIGAEPHNGVIRELLDIYEKREVSFEESNNRLITRFFIDKFNLFSDKNIKQVLGDKNILLPTRYFYLPLIKKSKNSYSYHLFINSWTDSQKTNLKKKIIKYSPIFITSYVRNRNGIKRFYKAIDYSRRKNEKNNYVK